MEPRKESGDPREPIAQPTSSVQAGKSHNYIPPPILQLLNCYFKERYPKSVLRSFKSLRSLCILYGFEWVEEAKSKSSLQSCLEIFTANLMPFF